MITYRKLKKVQKYYVRKVEKKLKKVTCKKLKKIQKNHVRKVEKKSKKITCEKLKKNQENYVQKVEKNSRKLRAKKIQEKERKMNIKTTAFNVEKYVKHLKYGQLFTFSQVMLKVKAEKDTVSHALAKLQSSDKIILVRKGIYLKPKQSKFGHVLPAPGEVVKIVAKNNKASVYPSGASLLNSLGISTQMAMGETYVSSKRIQPFCVNNTKIHFNYSRAFENAEKKLKGLTIDEKELSLHLWIILEYMGQKEASLVTHKLEYYWSKMSDQSKEQFKDTLNGKLTWAKLLMTI